MKIKKLILCSLFICLITAGAYIKIPFPAVPLSLQLPFVILCGILLNRKSALICTSVYLIAGLAGLPLFSSGGGISYILQPTFGYIAAFIPCAFIVSSLCSSKACSFNRLFISALTGAFNVHIIGFIYFIILCKLYLHSETALSALAFSLFAAIPKDIIMCFAAATAGKRLKAVHGLF